jgi:hypothetical protein
MCVCACSTGIMRSGGQRQDTALSSLRAMSGRSVSLPTSRVAIRVQAIKVRLEPSFPISHRRASIGLAGTQCQIAQRVLVFVFGNSCR